MAVDDVANALRALQETDVRASVLGGEQGDLPSEELTGSEWELVRDAAGEDIRAEDFNLAGSRFLVAAQYVRENADSLSPQARREFGAFFSDLWDQHAALCRCIGSCKE